MHEGETIWGEGSTIRIRKGSLTVANVDLETARAFDKHRAAIESGHLRFHVSIRGQKARWKIWRDSEMRMVKPSPAPLVKAPRTRRMVVTAAQAAARVALSGFEQVSKKEFDRRMGICSVCPNWDGKARHGFGKCTVCGCTKIKHQWASEKCPEGRW